VAAAAMAALASFSFNAGDQVTRYLIGQSNVVLNVVEATDLPFAPGYDVLVDPTGTTNVGAAYDPKDIKLSAADQVSMTMLFRHENLIRELIRTIRTNSTLNTQATTAGLPTSANAADVTRQQFNDFVKTLVP
jgi:hypothetical protein